MSNLELLSQLLEYKLNEIFFRQRKEIPTVEEFVKFLNSNNVSLQYLKHLLNLNIRSVFIHQKPYVFFIDPPKICGNVKVELGDILFIVKYKNGNKIIDYRGSFAQAKSLKTSGWEIEPHQLEFLARIKQVKFKFANKYKNNQYNPIHWKLNTSSIWFSHYLLLSLFSLSLPTKYVYRFYRFYHKRCKPFKLQCCLMNIRPTNPIEFCPKWSFSKFLSKFLRKKGIGFRIKGHFYNLIQLLYSLTGLTPDPPEEFINFVVEEPNNGFAIVEFTFEIKEKA